MLDPATLPSALANRMLRGETWARDKLALHAGSTFAVIVGPAVAAFRIGPDGTLNRVLNVEYAAELRRCQERVSATLARLRSRAGDPAVSVS